MCNKKRRGGQGLGRPKRGKMEEKRKKKLNPTIVVIVIIVILALGAIGYVVFQKDTNVFPKHYSFRRISSDNSEFRSVDPTAGIDLKPIIYIYPTEEQDVEVVLGNPERLSCTYPKYENSWKVKAYPNGDLEDLKTGRKLYSLYWEGKDKDFVLDMTKGFVVKGEDTAKFLEEKLEILGLTYKEAEEFIVYWLPKMENNKYNYIYFESMEEIEENMPLNITPKPDTLIRVMMDFKAIDEPIEVEEQDLDKVARSGYTVVEWGGSEY